MEKRIPLPIEVLGMLREVDRRQAKHKAEDRVKYEREVRAKELYERAKTLIEEYERYADKYSETPPVTALDRQGRRIELIVYAYRDYSRYPLMKEIPPIIGINAKRVTETSWTWPFGFRITPDFLPSRAGVEGPITEQNESGQSIGIASSLVDFINKSLSETYIPRSQLPPPDPKPQRRGILNAVGSLINRRRSVSK